MAFLKIEEGKLNVVYRESEAHEDDFNCVAWCKRTGLIVSCSDDSKVKVWTIN